MVTGNEYAEMIKPCFSCLYFEVCPKAVLPETMACELSKLGFAMREVKNGVRVSFKTIVKSLLKRKTDKITFEGRDITKDKEKESE